MTLKGPTRRRSSVSEGKGTREKEQLRKEKKGKKEELMQEKLKKLEQRKYLLTSLGQHGECSKTIASSQR